MYSENLIKSNLFPEISPNCEWTKYGEEGGQSFFYLIAFNPYNPLVSNDPTLNNNKKLCLNCCIVNTILR